MTTRKRTSSTTAGKNPKPATTAAASGAVIEKSAAKLIEHPAVDANPREGTTADMNRIDFNDPTKSDAKAVADNLKDQG